MARIQYAIGLALAGALALPAAGAGHGGDPHKAGAAATAAHAAPLVLRANGTAKLSIGHVQDGCHVWSDGKRESWQGTVVLGRGGRLALVNRDLDAHELVQLAGPRLRLGAPMAMNGSTVVAFPKAGVYRLATRRVEMEGMAEVDVETEGPDHSLALTVVVS